MIWMDVLQGLSFAIGFAPVLVLFFGLLRVLESQVSGDSTENQRREESEYRRGFSDGLESASKDLALKIVDENIQRNLSRISESVNSFAGTAGAEKEV